MTDRSVWDTIGRGVALGMASMLVMLSLSVVFGAAAHAGWLRDPDFSIGFWTGIFFLWFARRITPHD